MKNLKILFILVILTMFIVPVNVFAEDGSCRDKCGAVVVPIMGSFTTTGVGACYDKNTGVPVECVIGTYYTKSEASQINSENRGNPDSDTSCPLGSHVTRDLSGVLKIFRIVAPLMCIAFSVVDAIKSLAQGDADSEIKKVAKRFGQRMLYTILLFFMATIVNSLMQLMDVWDAEGQCEFEEYVKLTQRDNVTSSLINNQVVDWIQAKLICEGYRQGTWDATTYSCISNKPVTNCDSHSGGSNNDYVKALCTAFGCVYEASTGKCNQPQNNNNDTTNNNAGDCSAYSGIPHNADAHANCISHSGCQYNAITGACVNAR